MSFEHVQRLLDSLRRVAHSAIRLDAAHDTARVCDPDLRRALREHASLVAEEIAANFVFVS